MKRTAIRRCRDRHSWPCSMWIDSRAEGNPDPRHDGHCNPCADRHARANSVARSRTAVADTLVASRGNADDSVGMDDGTLVGVTFGPGVSGEPTRRSALAERRIRSSLTHMAATLVPVTSRSPSLSGQPRQHRNTAMGGAGNRGISDRDQLLGVPRCSPMGGSTSRLRIRWAKTTWSLGFNGVGQRWSVALGGHHQAGNNGIAVRGWPTSIDHHDGNNR